MAISQAPAGAASSLAEHRELHDPSESCRVAIGRRQPAFRRRASWQTRARSARLPRFCSDASGTAGGSNIAPARALGLFALQVDKLESSKLRAASSYCPDLKSVCACDSESSRPRRLRHRPRAFGRPGEVFFLLRLWRRRFDFLRFELMLFWRRGRIAHLFKAAEHLFQLILKEDVAIAFRRRLGRPFYQGLPIPLRGPSVRFFSRRNSSSRIRPAKTSCRPIPSRRGAAVGDRRRPALCRRQSTPRTVKQRKCALA